MAHVALAAVGADRPGIVAAVTQVLVERGCNLEDASMAILRGHFAMMLVVDVPDAHAPSTLEAALAPVADAFELVITVRPLADADAITPAPAGESWTVAV